MAIIQQIQTTDSAADAIGKMNDNFTAINTEGSGGGGSVSSGIIARNEDAVNRIYAAKKHFDMDHPGVWTNYNNEDNFCIAHASDLHVDVTRLGNFRDFVDGVTPINAAVISGDLVSNGTDAEFTAVNGVAFSRIQPIKCIGNHERWGGFSLSDISTKMGISAPYYKVDYGTQKIRIIVLNRYDVNNETKAVAALDGHWSQTQIEWFISQLKDAITNDYNVIVVMHSIDNKAGSGSSPVTEPNDKGFYQRYYQWQSLVESVTSDRIIEDIIAAFRAGSSISKTYSFSGNNNVPSVTVSDSFSAAGKFVCYIVGHSHIDMTGYSKAHSDQLYLVCPVSCCIGIDQNNPSARYGTQVSDLPRVSGTKTEDCFNVYGIDLANKVVKVIRVGADMNDLMEKREVAYFDYQPSVS